jgi:WD40 repeat protein
MASPLAARLSRFLVRCYPSRWRQRYAAEVLEVLGQHQPTARTVLNLWANAVSAHLDPAWRTGRHPRIWLRRWAPLFALPTGAVLLMAATFWGYAFWKEAYGPPMPISGGTWGTAFSPDGRTVAVLDPTLEVWNVADRAHPKLADYPHGDDVVGGSDPAFSPDSRVLATGGGAVTLWNVTDPARLTQIALLTAPGGTTQVNAVAFSPDGRTLASGLSDGTVVLWEVADPARATRIATLTGQAGNLTALAFSPDGQLLASASPNGTVFLWNIADPAAPTRIATLARQKGGVSAVSFSPDGRLLASGSDGGTVILRDVADPAAPVITATLHFTIAAPRFPGIATGPDVALAFSANGHTLTTIADNTTVTWWNVTDPSKVSRISTISDDSIGAGEVAFSAGGRIVAGAPAAGDTLALWTLP